MTRSLRILALVIGFALVLAMPLGARASLIGDTVNCAVVGSLICAPPSAVVAADPPPEFALLLGTPVFDLDIGATTVLLTNTVAVGIGGSSTLVTLSSLSDTPQGNVIGFTFDFSNVAEFAASDVSFTADSLSMELSSTTWSPGQAAKITLLFSNETESTPGVPEPSTLVVLALGLVGAGLTARRDR